MVRINRIYTRTGDDGSTHLVGGVRVRKDCLRVSAYGDVDELNSCLGIVRTKAEALELKDLTEKLALIQNELFDAGAELATLPGNEWPAMARLGKEQIDRLESWIDEVTAELPELKSFVLPGGNELNAWLHLARTVCRRTERAVVKLSHEEAVAPDLVIYFNRLSDLLFAMARFESKRGSTPEYLWVPGKKTSD